MLLEPAGPLTTAHLLDWWRLYQDEPWGEHREDLRWLAHATLIIDERPDNLVWPYWETPIDDAPAEILERLRAHEARYRQ